MQSLTLSTAAHPEQVEQFRQLQSRLRDCWRSIDEFDRDNCDILVIPSLSLDQRELRKVQGIHHYEERLLFSLIRLHNPRTRLIYVTSQPIHPHIIDYYLQLLPGVPFSHARDRLLLLSVHDSSFKPLTQKILERPRLIARIKQAMRPDKSYMTCFNSTTWERDLAVQLGVPMLAVDPDLLYWGTKGGSRQIFAETGVPHPDGSQLVWNAEDLAAAAADLWERHPSLKRMVIKLNEGFSGEGNALLDLRPLQHMAPGSVSSKERTSLLLDRFEHLSFQCETETWANFGGRVPELGAIVEAFIEGDVKRSPSVQGRIMPNGEVEILSTHDQILGGPDGQIFLGCSFPADESYRLQLQDHGMRVGKNLADKGALERFSLDCVAVQKPNGGWDLHAIEINLRKGGTTHPFMTLKLLTNGRYDHATGMFYNQQGNPRFYVATDNLQRDHYYGLLPNDLMDIIAHHALHFDSTTETGTVFHLMGCLSEFGKLGMTSIGRSPEEANQIYNRVIQALDHETLAGHDVNLCHQLSSLPFSWNY